MDIYDVAYSLHEPKRVFTEGNAVDVSTRSMRFHLMEKGDGSVDIMLSSPGRVVMRPVAANLVNISEEGLP
jgi:hypothetical protein